jgi:hypothetical protein
MRGSTDDRRRFERVPGFGAPARLLVGAEAHAAGLIDVSVGGAALRCQAAVAPGVEVAVELPGAAQPLAARVARCDKDRVAVAFLQDAANRALAEAAMAAMGGMAEAA